MFPARNTSEHGLSSPLLLQREKTKIYHLHLLPDICDGRSYLSPVSCPHGVLHPRRAGWDIWGRPTLHNLGHADGGVCEIFPLSGSTVECVQNQSYHQPSQSLQNQVCRLDSPGFLLPPPPTGNPPCYHTSTVLYLRPR